MGNFNHGHGHVVAGTWDQATGVRALYVDGSLAGSVTGKTPNTSTFTNALEVADLYAAW